MVTIRHNQTNNISDVSIAKWLRGTNQDLYTILKIRDIVYLYQYINKKPHNLGMVELEHAMFNINDSPDSFYYTYIQDISNEDNKYGDREIKNWIVELSKTDKALTESPLLPILLRNGVIEAILDAPISNSKPENFIVAKNVSDLALIQGQGLNQIPKAGLLDESIAPIVQEKKSINPQKEEIWLVRLFDNDEFIKYVFYPLIVALIVGIILKIIL